MNFVEWFEIQNKCHKSLYGHSILDKDKWKMAESWEACKNEISKILEENKELEAINQNGKKVYKIYGNVIDKIENL